MILQEKIQKKAEGFGKLAPVFLEGTKFALENQWISVDEDLPYNHKELLLTKSRTINVLTKDENEVISSNFMIKFNNKWCWNGDYASDYSHWMIISKSPKE